VGIIPGLPLLQVRSLLTELPQISKCKFLLRCSQCKSVKVKNKIVYYEEIVTCRHLILWPEKSDGGPLPY
jgi:hypothetical protein